MVGTVAGHAGSVNFGNTRTRQQDFRPDATERGFQHAVGKNTSVLQTLLAHNHRNAPERTKSTSVSNVCPPEKLSFVLRLQRCVK